jgi:hypothetical protein
LAPRTAAPVELSPVAVEERVELERVELERVELLPVVVEVRVLEEAPLAVGAAEYNESLWNGVQLEEAGIRGS